MYSVLENSGSGNGFFRNYKNKKQPTYCALDDMVQNNGFCQ